MREKMKEKFDVVITNPPYNESTLSNGYNKNFYDKFVYKAYELADEIVMITKADWLQPEKEPEFYSWMQERRPKNLVVIENSKGVFEGADIKGGVCYFNIQKGYDGLTNYVYHYEAKKNRSAVSIVEDIDSTEGFETKVKNSILEKIEKITNEKFSKHCSGLNPYHLPTDLKGIPNSEAQDEIYKIPVYLRGGKKVYIMESYKPEDNEFSNKYNFIIPRNYGTGKYEFPNTYQIIKPNEFCTHTHFIVYSSDTKKECENAMLYYKTKFFRYLLTKQTIAACQRIFNSIPDLPMNKVYTDQDLYTMFNLTQKEIEEIEVVVPTVE